MALVVVSKPSGFQPVGTGELNYVFSQASIPGAGYHIEIELNGFSTPKFHFYPDSTGVITCNISPMLRANLLMSPTTSERFKNTYVKYQEVWDAGSNSQVPLSSDVIYFYIGSNNVLNSRTNLAITSSISNVFLLPSNSVKAWASRRTYVDFLHDNSLSASSFALVTGDRASIMFPFVGNAYNLESFNFINSGANLVTVNRPTLVNDVGTSAVTGYKLYYGSADLGDGFAGNMDSPAIGSVGTAGNETYVKLMVKKTGSPKYTITFKFEGTTGAGPDPNPSDVKASVTLDLSSFEDGVTSYVFLDFSSYLMGQSIQYSLEIVPNNDGLGDSSNYYEFFADGSSGPTFSQNVAQKSAGVWNLLNKNLIASLYAGISSTPYATMSIVEGNECDNPLYLKWLNDFGGLSTWLFDYNQVFNMIPNEADGRYKKMIVFLNQGSIDEWKALQELNRSGAEYGDNKKLGAYVVDFTDESNPINIFVEPNPASTLTKYTGNNTQLTLRYPLAENILI